MNIARGITALLFGAGLAMPATAQDPAFFRIGTGGAGGTYYPVGASIAMGISAPIGGPDCAAGGSCGVPGLIAIAQVTTASVFNNTAIQAGELEGGVAGADVTRAMYLGEGQFEGTPHDKLRIVANLYSEDLHLVLPKGDSIAGLVDLIDKRVGIAEEGSGTQVAVLQMFEAWGVTRDDIEEAEIDQKQSAERLASGDLDAYFYTAGWPVSAMSQLATEHGMELHSFSDDDLARINQVIPAYIPSAIPAGTYAGVDYPAKTPGVAALFVVSADLPDDMIYAVTEALWNENSQALLQKAHAKGKQITQATALDGIGGLGVPLHAGAEAYYRDAGLLP